LDGDQSPPGDGEATGFLPGNRTRIMYLLGYVVPVFAAPFVVAAIVERQYILATTIAAVILSFVVNGVALHFKKPELIPFRIMLIPMIASLIATILAQGAYGALWCYPALLFCFFVLTRRAAIAASLAIMAFASPLVYSAEGLGFLLRFVASMGLTIVVMNILTDVIRKLQLELMDQVITDPLTGAFNRRHMDTTLEEALERHRRSGAMASVLLIDIEHFKRVNDDFGHHVGDVVLKKLVALVKARTRKLDRTFRMGGEEFLVFLPDTPLAGAAAEAEQLRSLIAESKIIAQRPVTVSIGAAEITSETTVEQWIKQADDALYRAKESGRNRVMVAEPPPLLAAMGESDRRARTR
jgi:diguanylate cyclase (GGDEF)-like protein